MKVFSRYTRPTPIGDYEHFVQFDDVQRAGFIPSDVRVKSYINAGKTLQIARENQFQGNGSETDYDLEPLPATRKGYDIVDAQNDMLRIENEYRAKVAEVERMRQLQAQANEQKANGANPRSTEPSNGDEVL